MKKSQFKLQERYRLTFINSNTLCMFVKPVSMPKFYMRLSKMSDDINFKFKFSCLIKNIKYKIEEGSVNLNLLVGKILYFLIVSDQVS